MAKPSSKKRHRSACHWRSTLTDVHTLCKGIDPSFPCKQRSLFRCLAGANTLWPSLGDYVIGNHSYLCVVLWSHEDHPENKDKEHEQEQVPGWSIWKQGEQCPRREEDGRSHHRLKESQKGIRWEFRPSVISRVGILLSHHRKSDKEFFPGAGNQTGRDWKFLSLERSGAVWESVWKLFSFPS